MLLEADSCCDRHPGERVRSKLPEAAPRPSALRSGEAMSTRAFRCQQSPQVSSGAPGVTSHLQGATGTLRVASPPYTGTVPSLSPHRPIWEFCRVA